MQVGHLPVALSIATYDWRWQMIVWVIGMHWLPNVDSLIQKAGLAKPGFHCTVTHSILFAVVVSGIVAIFSLHYALFAFIAILTHYAADIGSSVGLPLLWPFSKKRFTLNLFKDTGYWGKEMYLGYYRQPAPWFLEGAVTIFFVYRLFVIY